MGPIDTSPGHRNERHLRRIESSESYQSALQGGRRFLGALGLYLRREGISSTRSPDGTVLWDVGGRGYRISVEPTLRGREARSDGRTIVVRILGPEPESRIHYAHSQGPSEAALKRLLARVRGLLRGGAPGEQGIVQAARQRQAITREIFPWADQLSGGQARVRLPGATLDVFGEREHDVHLRGLDARQLRAVLEAIAMAAGVDQAPRNTREDQR